MCCHIDMRAHRPADYRILKSSQIEIIALGTNSIATLILKQVNEGATGENAVVENAGEVDIIVGPGIILAHSMRVN